ncbi:hypothetical protein HDU98_009476 [Podochytrium sp. JEL0797]|nr:hypothetical protein HDU98_009476 [Podochytrium sp. JEL0797]
MNSVTEIRNQDSVSLSPLTGKFMFKGFKYKTTDLTLNILRGHMTLRSWNITHTSGSPMSIRLDGFELFIYNNSSAYEYLRTMLEKEQLQKRQNAQGGTVPMESVSPMISNNHRFGGRFEEGMKSPSMNPTNPSVIYVDPKPPRPPATASRWEDFIGKLFPFVIVGLQGAVVVGNSDIASLMVVDFEEMSGSYVRQELRLLGCTLCFRKNPDYRDPLLNQAARVRISRMQRDTTRRHRKFWRGDGGLRDSFDEAPLVHDPLDAAVEWVGLVRYNDDFDAGVGGRQAVEEYARMDEVITSEFVDVVYYSEDAGVVGVDSGRPAPKWGVDLVLHKSNVNYGPWTNRQRLLIQSYFFPPTYRSEPPTETPDEGYHRLFPNFVLQFKFEEGCAFKVPFREESKDPQFVEDSVNQETRRLQLSLRNPGWLEFAFKGDASYLRFDIPLITSETGYESVISMKMENLVVTTSLNYAEVVKAECLEVNCLLNSPVKWNGERIWNYNVSIDNSKLYYLMDHLTLVQDLMRDLSYSRTAFNPAYFVPIGYQVNVSFRNLELLLCVNRNNIVHIANDEEENSFASFKMERATLVIEMPFLLMKPVLQGIKFDFVSEMGSVEIQHPPSHAIGAFLTESSREVGKYDRLQILGSYEYYEELTAPAEGPDSIRVDIKLDTAALKAYGYVFTALFDILDNYLGEFSHFINTDEYRVKLQDPLKFRAQRAKMQYDTQTGNGMEISLDVLATNSLVVLPEGLFDCGVASVLHFERITLDLASNMVEQILKATTTPITWTRATLPTDFSVQSTRAAFDVAVQQPRNLVQIGGLEVQHRRLFGLAPKYLLYASDTIIHCQPVVGELLPQFVRGISSSLNAVGHHFSDADSAFPVRRNPSIDVVKIRVDSVKLSIWGTESVTLVDLERGVKVQSDSFVTRKWVDRTLVDVPSVCVKVLTVSDQRGDGWEMQEWIEVFKLETSVSVGVFTAVDDLEDRRIAQGAYVKVQDGESMRCAHLFRKGGGVGEAAGRLGVNVMKVPAGFDFDFDYEAGREKRARAATDVPADSFQKKGGRVAKSAGASPFTNRSSSFLGSKFSLDAKYKTHLRSFRETHEKNFTEFVAFHNDFDAVHHSKRRAFPYSDMELLNTLEMVDSPAHSKIIVRASECVNVLVTPFALKAVQEFVQLSLEVDQSMGVSLFDALQIYYTAMIVRPVLSSTQYTTLIISAPETHVQSIQDMRFPDSAPHAGEAFADIKTRFGYTESSLCSIDVQTMNLLQVVNVGMKPGALAINAPRVVDGHYSLDLELVKCSVRFLGSIASGNEGNLLGIPFSKQLVSDLPDLPSNCPLILEAYVTDIKYLCDFHAGPTLAVASNVTLNLQSRTFEAVFINETAEIVAGALAVWAVFAVDLHAIVTGYMEHEQMQLQTFIETVIDESGRNSFDPKFFLAPSSLWLLGNLLRKFQGDAGWKLLAHLRSAAKQLGPERIRAGMAKRKSSSGGKRTHLSDIAPKVQKWMDRSEAAKNYLLGLIFETQLKDAEHVASDLVKVMSGYSTSVVFLIHAVKVSTYEPGSDSVFQLSPMLMNFSSLSRSRVDVVGKASGGLAASSPVLDIPVFISASKCNVSFNPNIFRLLRHIVRVYNRVTNLPFLTSTTTHSTTSLRSVVRQTMDFTASLSFAVDELGLSATANNLSMRAVARSIAFNTSYFSNALSFNLPPDLFFSATASVKKISIDVLEVSSYGRNSLLTLSADGLLGNVSGLKSSLVAFDGIEIRLPKSLLKLQSFFELWGDALPEYGMLNCFCFSSRCGGLKGVVDLLFNKLLKELEKSSSSLHQTPPIVADVSSNLQFVVKSFVLVSDLLSSLRCRYSILDFILLLQRDGSRSSSDLKYSARLASHKIDFETRPQSPNWIPPTIPSNSPSAPSVYLLPGATLDGSLTTTEVVTSLSSTLFVGMLEGSFNVHLIDQLLTFQSLLGAELNDMVEMVMFYYRKRAGAADAPALSPADAKKFIYDVKIRSSGVEVAAESPQSKLLLSSDVFTVQIKSADLDDVSGSSSLQWNFCLGNCGLSLISNERALARIVIDVQLQNRNGGRQDGGFEFVPSDARELETIFLKIGKINGVLHPVGVGKVADFLLYYSKELDERSRRKTVELEIMKQNAHRLFNSVNNAPPKESSAESQGFFADKLVLVQVDHIGISFPLADGNHASPNAALLFCLQKIQYESYCLVENQGGISDISAQFVEDFNPLDDASFLAASHPVHNRFLLRNIQGKILQFFKEEFGSVKINASIEGFHVTLTSSITGHLNSLISIFASERNLFPASLSSGPASLGSVSAAVQGFTEIVFEGDFVFGAGVCKIKSGRESRVPEKPSHARKISNVSNGLSTDDSFEDQLFSVPGVDFKINGSTCFGDDSLLPERKKRSVYITQHILESENVLHPTVLAFFLDVVSNLDLDPLAGPSVPVSNSAMTSLETQQHTVVYFLKLSQTRVSLTCLPESKVNLNFILEEADVLVGFTPKGELQPQNAVNVTLDIKGMNGSLRHTFSPEDCFRWNISQLTISPSFLFDDTSRSFLLDLDSASITASLNVRQLHDLLLFQRLWITPLLSTGVSQAGSNDTKTASAFSSLLRFPGHADTDRKFTDSFHFCMRLPSIALSSDFGQSIGKTTLTASQFVSAADIAWTNESFGAKSLVASLSAIRWVCEGRFSGDAAVVNPRLSVTGSNDFRTTNADVITLGSFTVDKVEVQMQFHYERILIVEVQPLDLQLVQRWEVREDVVSLCSDVSVMVDNLRVIISRRTVPALYQLLDRLKTALEEKMNLDFSLSPPDSPALRRSSKLLSRSVLPSNYEVAGSEGGGRSVLWYSNGSRSFCSIRVELKSLLMHFMRYNFRDPDCARLISKAVSISLEHQGRTADILWEALKIKMDGLSIKKGTTRSLTPEEERMWTAMEWFAFLGSAPSKNVATVPAILITLDALSYLADSRVELSGETVFASQIDIALNLGLYRFLMELFEFYDTAFKHDGEGLDVPSPVGQVAPSVESGEVIQFVYRKGDFKFDPQLKVTGEATPRELIEWLGVNKTKIPEMLYLNAVVLLSEVVVWIARNS